MGTRRENRPVSMTVANGLPTLDIRPPCARPAEPRARDPPSLRRWSHERQGLRRTCHGQPAREDLPLHKAAKRREAMRPHRLSRTPDSQS